MIKCQTCGTENLESSQYCDECGSTVKGSGKKPDASNLQSKASDISSAQSASVTSVGIPVFIEADDEKVSEDSGNNHLPKGVHATLLIERGSSAGAEFQLSADESYIGRWDADNGVFPDVDLDAHDAEAKVSRRHARIIRENDKYTIEDLGSTNGTFVNRGRRLIPGNRQPVNDGDEIIVGKTFLRLHIV